MIQLEARDSHHARPSRRSLGGRYMYCPVCGAESAEGIRFCKQCGSGLTAPLTVEYVKPVRITGAVWAIAVMAFLCFGALFGSMIALVGMGIRTEDVLVPI